MTEQDHLNRIRLLSSRFYGLQGLRVALTGACISLVVGGYLIASPQPTDNGAMIALVAAFAPVIPGMWWLNRYYAATFGRQVWSPPRHAPLFVLGFYVVASGLNIWIPEIPAGAPTMTVVAAASIWVAIRDWPYRTYYLGATAAVVTGFATTASGVGLLAPNLTLGTIFLLVGASFVPIGLLDHLLLVKLMREARESQTAEHRAGP